MSTLGFAIAWALPGLLIALVFFGAIWGRVGSKRPFVAGLACFALAMTCLAGIILAGFDPFDSSGYGILGLIMIAGPLLLGTGSLVVGIVKAAR